MWNLSLIFLDKCLCMKSKVYTAYIVLFIIIIIILLFIIIVVVIIIILLLYYYLLLLLLLSSAEKCSLCPLFQRRYSAIRSSMTNVYNHLSFSLKVFFPPATGAPVCQVFVISLAWLVEEVLH